jgi:hypothetical protein
MRNKFLIVILAAILVATAVAPAMAQDAERFCVTVNTMEVCGTPEQLAAIIPLLDVDTVLPEATAEPSSPEATAEAAVPTFSIEGAVESVDLSNLLTVDDDSTFSNVYRNGTEMMFAEPGVLLVGPDFPQELIDASNGAIARVDPSNRYPMDNNDSTRLGCGEGRFVGISGNVMTIQDETVTITLGGGSRVNWHFFARCRFSDGEADSDAGGELVVTDYIPTRNLVSLYPSGAFISLESIMQLIAIATSNFSCGSEGCTINLFFLYDVNTQAYAVLLYTVEGGFEYLEGNWDADVLEAQIEAMLTGSGEAAVGNAMNVAPARPRGVKNAG